MTNSFYVRAVNTAADSENRIHDDRVAAEYGFRGGLVPGVTIYGYLASAAIERLGEEWLSCGAMDVRFFEPFYEGEQVAISIAELDVGRIQVAAGSRASATAWIDDGGNSIAYPPEQPLTDRVIASREAMLADKVLGTIEKTLDLSEPGMSAPLDAFIGSERLAHPAILLALANEILIRNMILGPWIHASSEIRNASPARDGDHLHVRGKIVDAYERKGHELVALDVAILCGDRLVSRIRHTAIWKPRK
jgi:acyl dehydratase